MLQVTGESDISESLPHIEALTEIALGEVRFGFARIDASELRLLSGLELFSELHGLSLAASPIPLLGYELEPTMRKEHLAHGLVRFHEGATDGISPVITDLWFSDSRRLRLRFDSSAESPTTNTTTWQVYQFDIKTGTVVLLAAKVLNTAGMVFFDVVLRNPFLPVLITVQTSDGVLIQTGVLLFPSLCRGGQHYAELCAFASAANITGDLAALSEILLGRLLDLRRGATTLLVGEIGILARCIDDADALFSSDIRAWMRWLTPTRRLDIATVDEDGRILSTENEGGGLHSTGDIRLDLPQTSLPSLQGLLADDSMATLGENICIAGFVVAEIETNHPLWSVGMPPLGGGFLALQPVAAARPFPLLRGKTNATVTRIPAIPFVVKFVETSPLGRKVTLLAPISPDIPTPLLQLENDELSSITVLIPDCGRPEDGLKALVESLASQTLSKRLDIVAIVSTDDPFEGLYAKSLLDRYFAGRSVVLTSVGDAAPSERLQKAASRAQGDYVMIIDRTVILHDPRTVSTLLSMASHESVASASCMLVRAGLTKNEMEVIFVSAGLFPIAGEEDEAAEAMHPMDCQDAFPLATYPVALNTPVLRMMSARAIADCGGLQADTAGSESFRQLASEKGLLHVCTTAISAGLRVETAPATNRKAIDTAVTHSPHFPLSAGLRRLRG
jgi:hypothetical protein